MKIRWKTEIEGVSRIVHKNWRLFQSIGNKVSFICKFCAVMVGEPASKTWFLTTKKTMAKIWYSCYDNSSCAMEIHFSCWRNSVDLFFKLVLICGWISSVHSVLREWYVIHFALSVHEVYSHIWFQSRHTTDSAVCVEVLTLTRSFLFTENFFHIVLLWWK
jgi:hypothetical protein